MAAQILIADDDPTIRLLLRRLVEKQRDWQVCGEASNGVEAIEGVERFRPDVVVMDLAMPVMNGLQAPPPKLRKPILDSLCCLSASRKSPSSSHGKLAMPDIEAL